MKDTRYHTTLDLDFIKVVSDDVKGQADADEQAMLRHPDVWDDWGEALAALKRDTEAQLAKRKAEILGIHQSCLADGPSGKHEYFAEKTNYEKWRAGAIRFKLFVEARIAELKKLKKAQPVEASATNTEVAYLLRWASNLIERDGEGAEWHNAFKEFDIVKDAKDGDEDGET